MDMDGSARSASLRAIAQTLVRHPMATLAYEARTLAILAANRAAAEVTGSSLEALSDSRLSDFVCAADAPRLEESLRHNVDQTLVLGLAGRFAVTTPHELHIGGPAEDGLGVACLLPTREATFRAMVEKSAEGLAISDADGTLRYVNPALAELLGHRPEDRIGRFGDLDMHPDDRRAAGPDFAALRAAPGGWMRRISRHRHADGSYRWMEATVRNLFADPTIRGYLSSFRDVTDRVRAEEVLHETKEALRRSEAGFRILLDRLPSAVLVLRDTTAIYANVTMARLIGYDDPNELVGRAMLDFTTEAYRDMVRRRYEALATKPYNGLAEAELLSRDGTAVPIEVESLRIAYDGAPATVVVARDLRERRELMARLAAADRMLSIATLAAGVAHEINNPLTYVLANLTLADEAVTSLPGGAEAKDRMRRLLHDADDGARRVRDVVRDLRTLSRDDGTVQEDADLHAVLETSIRMAQNEIRHRARLVRALEPVPRLRASASRVGQVCLNLLLNAAQAIPDGNAELHEIRVACRELPGDRVEFEVSDTGPGIPREVLGRVFEPFFTTKPMGMGTGLGLAVSHGIVQSLGGSITAESEVGKGATFRVVLPAQRSAAVAPAAPIRGVKKPLRILVVDDDPHVGGTLRTLLEVDGHDAVTVASAEDGLSHLARADSFDAIFCDLMMPNMNGLQFYERVTRIAPALAQRIAFVTGGAFTAEASAFLARSTNPVLNKPFEMRDLRAVLDSLAGA
jgi:PAS domain S-box-containing protein